MESMRLASRRGGRGVLITAALAACTIGAGAAAAGALPTPASGAPGASRAAGPPSAVTPASYLAAAWPTYNRTANRGGSGSVPAPGTLRVGWRDKLDGAVYGQPLLVGNLVMAATENDTIYALDGATGKSVWHVHVASPVSQGALHGCGDIFPLGITGTPVYDDGNGLIYAVAEGAGYAHVLVGLSVTGHGAIMVRRSIPAPDGQPAYDQQRPALALDDGRIYVAFGGLFGDCGPYKGSVVSVPASGTGALASYVVPTAREGAVWGTAGPVISPDGSMLVSAGNGAAAGPPYDYSDSVTRLSTALRRISYFAPATWAADNASDLDLGSTQPAIVGSAVLIVGKRGTGYLLNAGALGGIGHQVASAAVCKAFGAAAVSGGVVYEPCRSGSGVAAVQVSLSSRRITVLWRGPANANGSPVVGGGVVWVTDPAGGILYALSPASGHVVRSLSLGGALSHFSSLSIAGSHAYVGTLTGIVAVSGA